MENNIITKNKNSKLKTIIIIVLLFTCLIGAVIGLFLKQTLRYRDTYPDFTKGYTQSDASYFVNIHNLKLTTVYVEDESPEGTVLSQSKKPGEKVVDFEEFSIEVSYKPKEITNDNDKIDEWVSDVENGDQIIITVLGSFYADKSEEYKPVIEKQSILRNYKLYYFDTKFLLKEDLSMIKNKYNLEFDTEYIKDDYATPYSFAVRNNVLLKEWYAYEDDEYLNNILDNLRDKKDSNESNEYNDEIDDREYLTKKDKDYEYKYYLDDEDEYASEVISFKINGKEIINRYDGITEIPNIKKYNDFIAIEEYFANTGGPSYTDLYIYDYKGNLLFVSEDVSILDLKDLINGDSNEKWNTGYMYYDSYTYDEESKNLEVKYVLNIYSLLGEAVASIPWDDRSKMPFCIASKSKTLYDKATISQTLNNNKFDNRKIIDKTEFNINNYSSSEKELYYSECGKK